MKIPATHTDQSAASESPTDRRRQPARRRAARLAVITAAVALPVVLAVGCLPGSDDSEDSGGDSSSSEATNSPKPAPVKFKSLPDPCKSIGEKTIEDLVPGVDKKSGKNLKTEDQDRYNSCLWTGLDDYDYRALTVSLYRFDSETAAISGDKRAKEHADKQRDAISTDDDNKSIKESKVDGVGDRATSIGYNSTKKDGDKSEDYREHRVVVLNGNVVLTVDYSGAGFEDAKLPSANSVRKHAEKAAKEALSAVN